MKATPDETPDSSRFEEFLASDATPLAVQVWEASLREGESKRGTLVCLHGIQSHSGWYGYSSAAIAASGWDVHFLNRRGSGRSGGERGHAPHADRLVNDTVQYLKAVRHRHITEADTEPSPIVLLGLSWGGKLAACVAARRPDLCEALVLLYPGICAHVRPSRVQKLALGTATGAGITKPRKPIPLKDPALFTSVPEWQQFIRDDELSLRDATLGFYASSVTLDHEVKTAPKRLTMPTLLMLAGRDRIVDSDAMRYWFREIAATDATLIEYPHAAHTLEFEPDRERFVSDLVHWLAQMTVSGT